MFTIYSTDYCHYWGCKLGLIGFFNLNLVALLFGSMSWISRIIYGLVGICGLYLLTFYGDSDTASEES